MTLGNKTRRCWPEVLAGVVLLLLAPLAQAQAGDDAIGYVKTVTGQALVITAGQSVKALPGTAVLLGSLLKTGRAASMGVTFKDDTVMSFGPETELTVDEYLYAPAQDRLKLGARLGKGTLNYLSGVIAKLKPDAVQIKTPTGIIGVRGTRFVVTVEEE
ncbi:MAG: FecR domain-containing protein [Polaromonas sp.]|nr:FecR domain-containing protein [Polaromonas sp.]